MEMALQTGVSANTGVIPVAQGKVPSVPFATECRTFTAACTSVGAINATVKIYQVVWGKWKRLIATLSLTQAAPVAGVDLMNVGVRYIAEVTFTANPSNDTVDVVMDG